MNSAKAAIVSFIVGTGFGAVCTWFYLNTVYEQRLEEDIKSVREAYAEKDDKELVVEDSFEEEKQISISEYTNIIKDNGYQKIDYNAISKDKSAKKDESDEAVLENDTPEKNIVDKPYVIAPEEYGEFEDYNQISLVHYADGVLADSHDNIIDDVDEIVGSDYVSHFGDYEDDSVHIRNDSKRCDYEILIDERNWSDILESKPYLKED